MVHLLDSCMINLLFKFEKNMKILFFLMTEKGRFSMWKGNLTCEMTSAMMQKVRP